MLSTAARRRARLLLFRNKTMTRIRMLAIVVATTMASNALGERFTVMAPPAAHPPPTAAAALWRGRMIRVPAADGTISGLAGDDLSLTLRTGLGGPRGFGRVRWAQPSTHH